MKYWLMKSEPETFSIDDLKKLAEKSEPWDGIRNYQARNFMRDGMNPGDMAFFYHSNTKVPGIVGIMKIVGDAYPDKTQFDLNSNYYDPKSTKDNPRWLLRDVKFVKKFNRIVSLNELKKNKAWQESKLIQKGSRLSIIPVSEKEWDAVISILNQVNEKI